MHANAAAVRALVHVDWFQAHAVPLIAIGIFLAIAGIAFEVWMLRQAFKLGRGLSASD